MGTLERHHPESRFYQPWYSEHQSLLQSGWKAWEQEKSGWEQVVLFGGKQKEENNHLICCGRQLATPSGYLYFVIPNEHGSKSYQKGFEESNALERLEVGRKSRLYVLRALPANEAPLELHNFQEDSSGDITLPGLFSWTKGDRGSELLCQVLREESLRGPIADLGAGWGYLARALPKKAILHLIEADQRGLDACLQNVDHPSLHCHWADVVDPQSIPQELHGNCQTVVTNPPFHQGKKADPVLGGAFVASARKLLRRKGQLYLVGNDHLPYRKIMKAFFPQVDQLACDRGFRVLGGRLT